MGILTEHETVERLNFFTGQRLFASDLQEIEAFNREMRWLHNQSMHSPGIGIGFSVHGETGDGEVTVEPGYAIDNLGREMILIRKQVLSVPPVADDGFGNPINYDLAISYPEDRILNESETGKQIIWPNRAVRLKEEPIFHWIELDQNLQPKDDNLKEDIKKALKIIIKRISVQNCRIIHVFTDFVPRKAQPEILPHIIAGRTDPIETHWTFWTESFFESEYPIGLTTRVDTSIGKFKTTPSYFVHIEGERFVSDEIDTVNGPYLLDGLVNIYYSDTNIFEIKILMPQFGAEETPPATTPPLTVGLDGKSLISGLHQIHSLPINPLSFFNSEEEANKILKELNWQIVWLGTER